MNKNQWIKYNENILLNHRLTWLKAKSFMEGVKDMHRLTILMKDTSDHKIFIKAFNVLCEVSKILDDYYNDDLIYKFEERD